MSIFPFSHRTDWSLESNPLSIALDQLKTDGVEILDLTESNPTRCEFNYPSDWLKYLQVQENLIYAPESQGMLHARQTVAEYYHVRSLTVDPKNILLTSSTSEGYSFLFKLLANAGDHVLIPRPSYPLFQFLLELHDVEFDYYPLEYKNDAWVIDQKAFQELITPKTKAVIVVNPNNPTCSYIGSSDLIFLNELCAKNKMAIISDEVFLDYQLDKGIQARSLIENTQSLTFVLSGVSKILALPQMKLSWVAVSGPELIVKQAMEKLEIIADTYLSVNTPVQNALAHWIPESEMIQKQILERVRGNLKVLSQYDFKILSVQGGWYAVIETPDIHSEEDFILSLLKEDHILVHPGYFFDFDKEGYMVLSLLPKPEIFKIAIEQIFRKIKLL